MSLRELAALDARAIVEDAVGYGWSITVISPAGVSVAMRGLSTDVHLALDVNTEQDLSGMSVSVRRASVALSIAALAAAGLAIPEHVAQTGQKPWQVLFDDVQGTPHRFKVVESKPDRAIGLVVCMLETYKV